MAEKYKYEKVIYYLRNQISDKKIGFNEKIPSENELSETFGLSRFTVRRAIEILTNEGLLEKRHGSGTFVKALPFQKQSTGVIGVITTYLDDYIFPSIIKGIENVMTKNGYAISLGITSNDTEKEAACLQSMLSQNIDGLIIEGTKSALPNPNLSILQMFVKKHIPLLFINGNYSGFESSYVLMNDEGSGYMATQYLLENGHTEIGGIFKSDDIQGHKRYNGFVNACHEFGIKLKQEAVLWYTTEDIETIFSKNYDSFFMQRFQNCSALICYNDQIAVKTIETFERNGKFIPQDVSVIGFDDSELCKIPSAKLTSVSHARSEMGEKAASAILDLLKSEKEVKTILLSKLVLRDSVKKLV
jgi:GntR family transcriptional regulator, arabinose operon transcriptional repressor